MIDSVSEFRSSMQSVGLNPPPAIEPGIFHRFPGVGKSNGNRSGWCILFEDGMGGCFGDWSSGLSDNWRPQQDRPLSLAEQAEWRRKVALTKKAAEKKRATSQTQAAQRAEDIWNASVPAPDDHPYLIRKGIKPHGIRLDKKDIVVPIKESGNFFSLQYIDSEGNKRFLTDGRTKGGYFCISSPEPPKAVCIVEGFATGASIFEATGYQVAVAFNCGNLLPVAQAMRKYFPDLPLIVCADDDVAVEGNPGLSHAKEAALAVDGLLAVPDFGKDRQDRATDFNDMASQTGLAAVAKAIEEAKSPQENSEQPQDSSSTKKEWPEPQPLISNVDPEPYPIDALPETIGSTVKEVLGFVQSPVPLVASSALAAISLACQSKSDVKRAEQLTGPCNLFLLTIADSGERKSTCDDFFTKAIRNFQNLQEDAFKPELEKYRADLSAWETKRAAILENIKKETKSGKPTEGKEQTLRELEAQKPDAPKYPKLLRGDETPENLAWVLAKEWPSGGVVSAEAGIIFGAHGMGKDTIMRNLSLLNILWDAGTLDIGRKTSESFTVRGCRLTVGLQIQEATLRSFFEKSGGLARGIGFLSRFLVAWPESTQGTRYYKEPSENWPALEQFNKQINWILNQEDPINDDGVLNPPLIPFSPEAKQAWVSFHDAIEAELTGSGSLYDVRDVASKSADNATRLACLFHIFENEACGAIGLNTFQSAAKIISWHLTEARRFFGELALPFELSDPIHLDRWLVKYCIDENTLEIPRREIQRRVTPSHLRQGLLLDQALQELVEAGRIRMGSDRRKKTIHVNPVLLEKEKS